MKIKKKDIVQIISGKDKGKRGEVLRVLSKKNKLIVEGLNLLVKHIRPRREGEKGQRIKIAAPLAISKVLLVCPKCKKQIRLGFRILTDGRKVRFCRKCKEII